MTAIPWPLTSDWLAFCAYALYLAGPLAWFLLISRHDARRNLRAFLLGVPTFWLAWLTIAWVFDLLGGLGISPDPGTLTYGAVFSALAGLVEESCRWIALGLVRRWSSRVDWRVVLIYAAGHTLGECSLTATARFASANLSGDALLRDAAYHVVGAFIVQACFTALVLRSVQCRAPSMLAVAMLWHFAQDMPWTTAVGSPGDALSLVLIFCIYPCLLLWLLRRWFALGSAVVARRATLPPVA